MLLFEAGMQFFDDHGAIGGTLDSQSHRKRLPASWTLQAFFARLKNEEIP
jgi:hypothetical protein